MILGPLSAALGIVANPIPSGYIELPQAYGEHLWGLMKGRPTKYIKRVPKPGGGYRYYYAVGHGGGVHAEEHMVEGSRFAHGDGHFHIVKAEGDKLHVRNTATGEEHTITKKALAQKLAEHHAEGLKAYRDRAAKALAEAKANKASPKQIARLEERVKRAGGAGEAKPSAEHMEKVKSMRTSQLELPANNPRHPLHEAAKAEMDRREKLVTPAQAIEIARKALAIERRQAGGGEAGRRAHSTQADEAAMDAFNALTPKQSEAAMDALRNERHAKPLEGKSKDDGAGENRVKLSPAAQQAIKDMSKPHNFSGPHDLQGRYAVGAIQTSIKDGHLDLSGAGSSDANFVARELAARAASASDPDVRRELTQAAQQIKAKAGVKDVGAKKTGGERGSKDPMDMARSVAQMQAKWREGQEIHERNKQASKPEIVPLPEMPAFDRAAASADRRAHHDDASDAHIKARNKHWNIAEKAKSEGRMLDYATHQRAGNIHHDAVLAHILARDKGSKKNRDAAEDKSRRANAASHAIAIGAV